MVPQISVVMPVRNAEKTLPECLKSIANQTFPDFELVVVNDGSQDGSIEALSHHLKHDDRLRIVHSGNAGLVASLNQGVMEARASLIARMDADDIMHPERLAEQFRYLNEHPEISVVGCRVELFPCENVKSGNREYARWQNSCITAEDIETNLYVESPLAHPSVLFRREAFEKIGGYAEGMFPEDYDLWLRMFEHGYRMAKIPKVLLRWRESSDRTSRTDPRYSRELFDSLRADYLARDSRLQHTRKLVIWGAGRATRKRVRYLLNRGKQNHAWVDIDPRKIGTKVFDKLVYPPEWLHVSTKPFVLVYVTNHGARDEICERLHIMGYRRGSDYLAVG